MKAVALLSGGIDSPVAAYLMSQRGCEMILLHMDNRPYSSEGSVNKVARLAKVLRQSSGQDMPALSAPHGRNQAINANSCRRPYQCVLCKRLMLKVAKEIAIRNGAEAIVTGESLGQVASQTLLNLRAEEHGLDFPVLRPLIGLDKLEIEGIAKRIGTYEISIQGDGGPACLILPERVITDAVPENVMAEEDKVDISEMVRFAADNAVELRGLDTGSS
jgi:thiamine biosynthesis protein ThiI